MTSSPLDPSDPTVALASDEAVQWAARHRARRALVVVDVVESVRLMLTFETDVIDRWRRFVHEVVTQVLPFGSARMVKSLGDGLLLEFEHVPQAVTAAVEMQRRVPAFNTGRPAQAALHLRVGVHVADVMVDVLDVFGSGVNLAARLAALGAPGDVVVSADVQAAADPPVGWGADVVVHDMGRCFVKHIDEPVHAYRLLSKPVMALPLDGVSEVKLASAPPHRALVPRVAVLPLLDNSDDARMLRVGASLADDLINHMARCAHWQITSRLSTAPLVQRPMPLQDLGALLQVDFVVTGSVVMQGDQVQVQLSLNHVATGAVLWADTLHSDTTQLMLGEQAVSRRATTLLMRALLRREVALQHVAAVPNLPSYALLLQAIAQMHSLAPGQAERAFDTITHLAERHPRAPDVLAWQAQWHMLRYFQHQSTDPASDVQAVQTLLAKALALQPEHALALTLQGHVSAAIHRDNPQAEGHFRAALRSNPNESLAWLFLSHALACLGRNLEAVSALEQARALSPLDPLVYFHDVFAASVYGASGQFDDALKCAQRAVAANPHHLSSMVVLIVAQHDAGLIDEAKASAQRYLKVRPQASLQLLIDHHPAADGPMCRREVAALLAAGLSM
jgi:adenylate cyclase